MRKQLFIPVLAALMLYQFAGSAVGATHVVPAGESLNSAIASAQIGDMLILGPGRHQGPVLIDRTLTLRGEPGAIVDGQLKGSVITIDAPEARVEHLTVLGSGSSHETLDAGIKLTQQATRAQVIGNTLTGNLVGIDIHGAAESHVAGNSITGRTGHRMNERGNGIYVWNAPGAIIEHNTIELGRDGIFVNVSHRNVFRGNTMRNLRFAVHSMYANHAQVLNNVSHDNHLGFALMFSSRMTVSGNTSNGDRDHGIMLNYANESLVQGNRIEGGGSKCLFMYNANSNQILDNRFARCPIGIHFTAGSAKNDLSGNAFVGNQTQVKYVGTRVHEWSLSGRGNYWSDHASFDIDGDGRADQVYRPNDAIDQLIWTQPATRLLLGSPAVHLIRWAQSQFPALLPGGVIDSHPLMRPSPGTEDKPKERRHVAARD